nr:fusion protein [Paramyxoviridae sp.]
MVLKMVPNIENVSDCTKSVIDEYKKLLTRIVLPINNSLALMKSYITSRTTGVKFWGAVIGGVALGVATSAQITAGIALHNSIQNANAIKSMKESILKTNEAVSLLQTASRQTVIAISALQDQINNKIIPIINQAGCDIAKNTLKLHLNQYFSEISLIFGPNLRDPASETISIQVLSQAFNNDFESLLNKLGYNRHDLLDIIQSHSIRGRIIDVDVTNYFLTIQIEYPEMIQIPGAVVQEFNKITFNEYGLEWITIFPDTILVRGNLISNIDVSRCTRTDQSYICLADTSSPISSELYECITGHLNRCAKTNIVNSYAPRFALSNGVVFANCGSVTCVCRSSGQHILQDKASSNTMISNDICQEVEVDGIFITVGPKRLKRSVYSYNITTGNEVVIDKIDVGNQLSSVLESIRKSETKIRESNKILSRINPNIVNTNTLLYLIIISVIILIWLIVVTILVIRIYNKMNSEFNSNLLINRGDTINSLSQLIPVS